MHETERAKDREDLGSSVLSLSFFLLCPCATSMNFWKDGLYRQLCKNLIGYLSHIFFPLPSLSLLTLKILRAYYCVCVQGSFLTVKGLYAIPETKLGWIRIKPGCQEFNVQGYHSFYLVLSPGPQLISF